MSVAAYSLEEIELLTKLESIFMPMARRQREEFYERQKAEGMTDGRVRFVHYTSADAALKIIDSKRVWMRNTNCMSDYREVQHGFDILHKFFASEDKKKAFIDTLDDCVPGVAQEAIKQFDSHWNNIRFHTYVTSVSEHYKKEDLHGRLSMWRAFGANNAARVAIIFKVSRYSLGARALSVIFSPIAYLTEDEAHAVMQEIIQNVQSNKEFLQAIDRQVIIRVVFNTFLAAVTCLKHEGFKEEREWRAIHNPYVWPSTLIEQKTETVGGIPQPIYSMPFDKQKDEVLADLDFVQMFDRLIIGPSQYSWPMSEAFRTALEKAGVKDAASKVSSPSRWPGRKAYCNVLSIVPRFKISSHARRK